MYHGSSDATAARMSRVVAQPGRLHHQQKTEASSKTFDRRAQDLTSIRPEATSTQPSSVHIAAVKGPSQEVT